MTTVQEGSDTCEFSAPVCGPRRPLRDDARNLASFALARGRGTSMGFRPGASFKLLGS